MTDLAILNYSLEGTGTVAKSIEIATATRINNIETEIWAIFTQGKLRKHVPADCPVVSIGTERKFRTRGIGLMMHIPALARTIKDRKPKILMSAGNHFHIAAWLALKLSGQRRRTIFITRASNSSQRQGRPPLHPLVIIQNWMKYAGADKIVSVCEELSEEIRCAVPRKSVLTIANGVDVERVLRLRKEKMEHFFFKDANAPDKAPVIVTMGRLSRQKGFDLLIKAIAALPEKINAKLIIIGEGPDPVRIRLKKLATALNVEKKIDFYGYCSNPFPLISQADIFVCSSRWEGASNTLMEALLCDVGIVATNCPTGNREIINNVGRGTLAENNNYRSISESIIKELNRNFKLENYIDYINSKYSIKSCTEKWNDLFITLK
tara:strand:+ start:13368 stop:14504 length:1137 start_codon:yes stop_codon:yes gene_type:complete